jgi:hypothetical protein
LSSLPRPTPLPSKILDPVLDPILKKPGSQSRPVQFQLQKSDRIPVSHPIPKLRPSSGLVFRPGTGIGGSNMGKLGTRPTIVQASNQQNWKCLKVFIKHAELIVNNNTR